MRQLKSDINIAFLSTYPPTKSKIASFTENLITTMSYSGIINTHVIAVSNSEDCIYDNKVIAQISQNVKSDYTKVARRLNNSKISLLIIEHKQGVFGGDQGDYILDFINHLEIPFVATLHTILSEPSPKQRFIINELGRKSERILTMAYNTKEMLQTIYDVKADKIEVIHHGVPKKQFLSRDTLKKKFGYENRQIISTFARIWPGNGLEHGIEAIAKVIRSNTTNDIKSGNYNDVLYLILGHNHPVLKEEGTIYKNKLEELINKQGLSKNIKFINKHLSTEEKINYLQMSDIYLSPLLTKDTAVSGTLACAVGYGKAIVSTPYLYAKEMLSEGNGLLAEFGNPDSLADGIKQLLDEPYKKSKMERNTLKIGRTMYWDKVGIQYTNVFLSIINSQSEVSDVQSIT